VGTNAEKVAIARNEQSPQAFCERFSADSGEKTPERTGGAERISRNRGRNGSQQQREPHGPFSFRAEVIWTGKSFWAIRRLQSIFLPSTAMTATGTPPNKKNFSTISSRRWPGKTVCCHPILEFIGSFLNMQKKKILPKVRFCAAGCDHSLIVDPLGDLYGCYGEAESTDRQADPRGSETFPTQGNLFKTAPPQSSGVSQVFGDAFLRRRLSQPSTSAERCDVQILLSPKQGAYRPDSEGVFS